MYTTITSKNDKVYYKVTIKLIKKSDKESPKFIPLRSHIFEEKESYREYIKSAMRLMYKNIMAGNFAPLLRGIDPRFIKLIESSNEVNSYIGFTKSGKMDDYGCYVIARAEIRHVAVCESGSARYIKLGNFTISRKNDLFIITDHRGVVINTFDANLAVDLAGVIDVAEGFIEQCDSETISGDDFNLKHFYIHDDDSWEIVTKETINVNGITITPGTLLEIKDKFPGDNGLGVDKGYWQVKDPYGGTFNMSYEDRKKYFEGVV